MPTDRAVKTDGSSMYYAERTAEISETVAVLKRSISDRYQQLGCIQGANVA